MEILAAIALGLGAAGVVMLLRRVAGGVVPRAAAPVAAGLAMFAFGLWTEYTWFARQSESLPERLVIFSSVRESSAWRPWAWAWPRVTRFAAADVGGARRNERLPGQVITTIYLFARHQPPAAVRQIVDCAEERRADLAGEARFDRTGRPEGLRWVALDPDAPLYRVLCQGKPGGSPE